MKNNKLRCTAPRSEDAELRAMQAEIERLNGYVQKANMDVTAACVERDAALARLAESEAQNLMARQIILEHGEGVAGASPQQSPLLQFCTCEDCKPMECEGCRINRERRELLPAPSDTAITYMTGYSDCKEWAGATNQAQPSQAVELSDEEIDNLWVKEFVGQPFYTRRIAYARAIIAAINAKEQS